MLRDNTMSFDFQRRVRSFSAFSPYGISRKYQENILDEYQHAWEVSSYKDCESVIRSCEQKLIKLDKKTLVDYLEQFVIKQFHSRRFSFFIEIEQKENKYTSWTCLLHLLHVFCIPGQKEKIKVVQVELNEMLQYCKEERFDIFERYLSQRLKVKSSLTEIDLLTDQIDPHNEFLLKLCYWDIFCAKRNNECCKEFLQQNVDYLVSNIERSFQVENLEEENIIYISCTMLLCLLNWNICKTQNPVILQNREAQASSSVALVDDTSVNYSCTAHRVSNLLQIVWSKDDVSTVFNNYINKMSAMKTDLTEDYFCTDKIGPYFEFISKLCYWDYLCIKNDYKRCNEFLRRNADLFVSQIEEVVHGDKTKTKHKSCEVLLCLLNWNICDQKSTLTQSKIQNSEILAPPSFQSEEEGTTKNPCTVYKVLQKLLSTLSEDKILTAFNDYLELMNTMKSEITEVDFCNGKIDPYHEFLLKLCYCEKLWYENYEVKTYREFLRINAALFVSQIEEVVHGNKTKTIYISCKVLLCLLNWNICDQKSTVTQSKIQNSEIQKSCSFQSEKEGTTKNSCTVYKVRFVLENLLSTLAEDDISQVFNDYIDQMYAIQSEITPDGLCIGVAVLHHEYKLKLCYWRTICRENDNEAYKKFIHLYPEFLVSYIEEVVVGQHETRNKISSCKALLCILNWNICHQKTSTPLNFQDCSFTSEVKKSTKYQNTVYKVWSILQKLLSTLSEDKILTAFNDYLELMNTMKSEITEVDFCNGKIDPYHEFLLKLCYCEKLWYENYEVETYREFLRINAALFVSQIEEVVHGNKTKTIYISCKVLLCLLNWNICDQKSTLTQSKIQNSEILAPPSFQSEEEGTTKNPCTVYKVLQKLLSTLSEDKILTAFNDYLELMNTMKSEITEVDFCNGKIDPYHEFLLKLCYCEKLWYENYEVKTYREFLRINAALFVSQIEEVVHGNKTKTIYISCKVLLCLLNWNICDQKSTVTQSKIQNSEIQKSCSFQSEKEGTTKNSCTVYKVRFVLENLLSTLAEDDISQVFNDYIDQMYAIQSEITPDGLCIGVAVLHHEYKLKLCYWRTICRENDNEAYKKFIHLYPEFLVSYIEEVVVGQHETRNKISSCKALLCILNWNICHQKTSTPLNFQDCSFTSEVKKSTKYQNTVYKVWSILQKLLSTLSEDKILTAFNDYLELMNTMKSEITEVDFCNGKIDPYHEFLLKLCYCEKLWYENYEVETYREFLRINAALFVSQIEEVVHGNKTKTIYISCKVLLCLLNWNICDQKSTLTQSKIQNSEILAPPSFQSEEEGTTKNPCTVYKVLQKLLSTLSEDKILTAFNDYLELMNTMKSEITEVDFCNGKIDPYHEFLLKLCYCEKLWYENYEVKTYREFIRINAALFVSQIEEVVHGNKTKTIYISCKVLLCLLNWNICDQKSTVTQSKIQNSEIQKSCSFQSEKEGTTKNSCTVYKIRFVLENLLSTLAEDDISQVFNDYIDQMYAIQSEITPDGLCIGVAVLHHEYKLKLCYWRTICSKNDYEAYKKFIQLYPEFLVSYIQKNVSYAGKKQKKFYCRILLLILNSNICTLKNVPLLIEKAEKQASSSVAIVADSLPNYYCTAETIRSILQNLLSTSSEEEIITTFKKYLGQLYTMKSEDDFCTRKIEPYYEFLLKLCHCQILCYKNDETYREFLRMNADIFVSQIELLAGGNKIKWKPISCTVLLCLLKFNMCTSKTTPLMVQNTEILTCSSDASVADTSTKCSYTANTLWSLLKSLLSALSEDDMFTTFNNYLGQLYAMNSEITEDDFCTGKIEPYYEFLLKLCYCEKLCIENDEKNLKEFLQRNADFLVSQIEEGVNEGKTQIISCKVLLCLSKWGISNQNTAYAPHENILSQTLTLNSDFQDFINENALFFLSMVGTVMTKNNITVLINLCDVLLSIPYNGQHFHAVIGAVKKLIRYYATQVGMNKKILEWIIKLRYRVLRHLNENQKLDTAIKIEIDFQNLFNLLDDLLTNLNYNSKPLKRANNSFKSKKIHHRKKSNTGTYFTSHYHSEEEDEDFASHYHSEEEDEDFASHYHSEEEDEDFASHYHTMKRYEDYVSHYNTKEQYEDIVSYCQTMEQGEDFASHYHTMELFETRLRELWIAKIKCKVKATQISNKIGNKGRENLIPMEFLQTHTTMSEQDFMYEWKADLKENQLNIKTMEAQLKEIKMVDKKVDEIRKTLKLYEMLVLFMMTLIVMVGISNGHHKSAKLKKYLSLKYEYAKASLYLLWCSGDIEVHPGPSMNKKSLAHDSTIERRWIQNISPRILIRLPDHEQSKYKPTKKRRNDRENKEYFKTLLEICQEEKVCVPKMYLAEINAWETKEYNLLHKLFVHRCEIEIIIASIKDFLKYEGSTKVITKINVSLITELQTNEIVRVLENYTGLEDKSQTMVKAIRKIAGISNTCAHGKYLADKWDGIWDLPLENWPSDILLFDPNNRGKYKKKNPGRTLISDKELVDTFLSLPQITFPQKYKDMVDAYKLMRKNENKQHKEIFCGIYKRTTSIEKIDFALKHLYKNGIFTEEVHNILQKWWNMETVETNDDEILLLVNGETEKEGRPHILIKISTKFVTLTVKHTSTNSSQLVYDFPLNDELVPLKTMATTVGQTTIQKPSSDSYQKVTAKKYLTVSPKPDECPAANQVNLIIIPPEALTVLNAYFPSEIYPNSQAILESDIKHQHKISSQETALCSTIDFNQSTSSTNQISQLNHNIAISVQPGPILPTPNRSTTNLDDISSATKDSQNPDFHTQVSPTSNIGSSDSIALVNSESGNEDRDNTSSEGQDLLTDSDYSSDSSNNCVSKTSLKKRKCIEEDGMEMKKRKIPSLTQDIKQSNPTSQRKNDSLMDNPTTSNKNMDLLLDCLDIDLDLFDIDEQTFDVELNALDNEDKNPQICDKDGERQLFNENSNLSPYNINVSAELENFLQDMITCESEKMSQMKSYV